MVFGFSDSLHFLVKSQTTITFYQEWMEIPIQPISIKLPFWTPFSLLSVTKYKNQLLTYIGRSVEFIKMQFILHFAVSEQSKEKSVHWGLHSKITFYPNCNKLKKRPVDQLSAADTPCDIKIMHHCQVHVPFQFQWFPVYTFKLETEKSECSTKWRRTWSALYNIL